jgi:uncharacterized membrane protein
MKIRILAIAISFTVLLISCKGVYSQDLVKYAIGISSDGSATWIIRQTVGLNVSVDPLEFQNNLTLLVKDAEDKTGRNMTIESMTMTFTPSGSYKAIEYKFDWKNFSRIEGAKIIVGDVFEKDFFLKLCGDGEVDMSYPSQYIVETVSPSPYQRDDSLQSLMWLGTIDFDDGMPAITLMKKSLTPSFFDNFVQNAVLIVSLSVLVVGSSVGFYIFKRRKKRQIKTVKTPELPEFPQVESDEEKIVKLLKSSAGTLYQSAIKNQCKFSKAKTSQLLAVLENKGLVRRYKKGRDKVVVLIEQGRK